MITVKEYFGEWADSQALTEEQLANADRLLTACLKLEKRMVLAGIVFPVNVKTHSGVSGSRYGGFRPVDCPIGAEKSKHKLALAVDRFDPFEHIDNWCLQHLTDLEECGIYIEAPSATPGWSHWTVSAPRSGNRVFLP